MRKIETPIEGLYALEPKVWGDERGFFMETFNERTFRELGLPTEYKQDNFSRSARDVVRGLHFQVKHPQGKIVRVTQGRVWDVAVDIRRGSKTFGKWHAVELSAENKLAFWVPAGFAHGFAVLSDTADFIYKCTELYDPTDESGILWNDPDLNIPWPVKNPVLSAKDQKWGRLRDLVVT